MGTKKGRIYGKGAPFKWAPQRFGVGSCPKLPPPGSSTDHTQNSAMVIITLKTILNGKVSYHSFQVIFCLRQNVIPYEKYKI